MSLVRSTNFRFVLFGSLAALTCEAQPTHAYKQPLLIPGTPWTNAHEVPRFYPRDKTKYLSLIFRREFENHAIRVYINGHLALAEIPRKFDDHMGWTKLSVLNPLSKATITVIDLTMQLQWSFTKDPREEELLFVLKGTQLEVHVGPFITV